MFGGALTRVLLHAAAAPETKFDVRLAGDGRGQAPPRAIACHLTYDPADAVIVVD